TPGPARLRRTAEYGQAPVPRSPHPELSGAAVSRHGAGHRRGLFGGARHERGRDRTPRGRRRPADGEWFAVGGRATAHFRSGGCSRLGSSTWPGGAVAALASAADSVADGTTTTRADGGSPA